MIKTQAGVTLPEMAIVITIMGLVLGGLLAPLKDRVRATRIKETVAIMASVEEALLGHALTNGYLPCPATPDSNGLANDNGGGCTAQHGFVPAATLGLDGHRNSDQLLLDAWGNPVAYSVSSSDADSDGNWDFVAAGELQDVTIAGLSPDLNICSTASGASNTACSGAATTLTASAPLVIYSLGPDWASFSSDDQVENAETTLGGGSSGKSYGVASNNVFVHRRFNEQSGAEFDDIVSWVSPNSLYSKLLAVGRLP